MQSEKNALSASLSVVLNSHEVVRAAGPNVSVAHYMRGIVLRGVYAAFEAGPRWAAELKEARSRTMSGVRSW